MTQNNVTTELTTDFNKANGGPSPSMANTIALVINEKVTSENDKNAVWRVEISWTALVQDVSTSAFEGASGRYSFGILSTKPGATRQNIIFNDADAYSVGESAGGDMWSGSNPITADFDTQGTDRLTLTCQGVSGKNIIWSAHVRCIQQHLPQNVSVAGNGT